MKKIKYLIILLLLIIIFPVRAEGESELLSDNPEYDSYPVVINKYDISLIVHDNNTIEVNHVIHAFFKEPGNGLTIKIPLERVVTRPNGSPFLHRATIDDIEVSDEYTEKKGKDIYEITTGTVDRQLQGDNTIKISYLYKLGYDGTKAEDSLVYALKNQFVEVPVGKVDFKISLPKEFNKKQVMFYDENGHKIMGDAISYSFKNNIIVGEYNKVLMPESELTVACSFPNGYFFIESSIINKIIMFSIPAICVIVGLAYLVIKKKRKKPETIEFYPPDELNSVEMGYIIDGKVNVSDVLSLLPHLASKGYIRIVENNKDNYNIIKMKEYDGTKTSEKIFMDSLFAPLNPETDEAVTTIPSEEIVKRLSRTMSTVKKEIKPDVYNYWAITPTTSTILYLTCMLLSVFVPLLIITAEILIFRITAKLVIISIITLIMFIISLLRKLPITIKMFVYLVGLVPVYLGIVTGLMDVNRISFLMFIYSGICGLLLVLFFNKIPYKKIKDDQSLLLERIKGFRVVIGGADRDTLADIQGKDPAYYTYMYSYAFAFGLSTRWMQKFDTIAVQIPEWFELVEEPLEVTSRFLDNFNEYLLEKQTTIEKTLQMDTPKQEHEYKVDI